METQEHEFGSPERNTERTEGNDTNRALKVDLRKNTPRKPSDI